MEERSGWGVEAEGSVVREERRRSGGIRGCSEGGGMLIEGAEEKRETGEFCTMKGDEQGEVSRQRSGRIVCVWLIGGLVLSFQGNA